MVRWWMEQASGSRSQSTLSETERVCEQQTIDVCELLGDCEQRFKIFFVRWMGAPPAAHATHMLRTPVFV